MTGNPLAIADMRLRAAHLLMHAAPLAQLGIQEALVIIDVMRPVSVPAGMVVMQEGEATETDYMALLLEGEVRVESAAAGTTGEAGEEVVVSILDPGSLIGEMGLLDGAARSATCIAITDLKLATLAREALMALIDTEPQAAAKLLLSISKGLADRLRESNRRLRTLTQITRAMQRELHATHAVNQRLLHPGG